MGDIGLKDIEEKKSNQTHHPFKEYVIHRQAFTSKSSYVKIQKTAGRYDRSLKKHMVYTILMYHLNWHIIWVL